MAFKSAPPEFRHQISVMDYFNFHGVLKSNFGFSRGFQSESLLKPLKINDEITIIPQPARAKTKSSTPNQPAAKPAKVIEF